MKYQEEYQRFKYLLEYFVAHLEYIASDYSSSSLGYEEYIKPLVESDSFKSSGQGYNGQAIQSQVSQWDRYPNGQICINVYGANYQSRGTYLNWQGTGNNIMADWKGTHVESLYLQYYDPDSGERLSQNVSFTIKELGLFDTQTPNDNLCSLFDEYNLMIETYRNKQHNMEVDKYIDLLKTNKNLILTGAPGTGKTFLAKSIAEVMGAEVGFVQFHPSYDYTDFVEGLRPKNNGNGNVGFERKDGVFKEFCKKAVLDRKHNQGFNVVLPHRKSLTNKSFSDIYNSVENDIKEKRIPALPFRRSIIPVSFKKSRLYFGDTRPKSISMSNLQLLYEDFVNKEIYDLSSYDRDYFFRLITKLTNEATKTIDYVNYACILQEMLRRARNVTNNSSVNEDSEEGAYYTNPDILESSPKKKPYVFIIDEINRGEISKIFGELFFSIDPGYRGEKGRVNTQYQNMIGEDDVFKDGFYVPDDVYIIGTMNDIDRSVESMDFAMRRRFAWQEVTAEESYSNIIENDTKFATIKDEIKQRMFSLNKAIAEMEGLGESYQIGAAYFIKYLDYQDKKVPFECLWNNHLKGLLCEYLRGNRRAKEQLEKLHKAYNKTSTYE